MDDISQVAHIVAGMGVTFDEALIMVAAANHYAENPATPDEPTPPTTIGNITYVDFRRR